MTCQVGEMRSRSTTRAMMRSKRVVSVFSNAVIRSAMADIREVLMAANTVSTGGNPIAKCRWTFAHTVYHGR